MVGLGGESDGSFREPLGLGLGTRVIAGFGVTGVRVRGQE